MEAHLKQNHLKSKLSHMVMADPIVSLKMLFWFSVVHIPEVNKLAHCSNKKPLSVFCNVPQHSQRGSCNGFVLALFGNQKD